MIQHDIDSLIDRIDKLLTIFEGATTSNAEVLCVDDVCKIIGRSRSTVSRLMKDGGLPWRHRRRSKYFLRGEIEEWLASAPNPREQILSKAATDVAIRNLNRQKS